MLKIILNKTEIPYLEAIEGQEHYDNALRRVLTVVCAADAIGVDELNALMTEENLASLTMVNEEESVTNVYDGYVIKMECGIRRTLVSAETPETPAQYQDRLVFKAGRRTYIEQKLHELGL